MTFALLANAYVIALHTVPLNINLFTIRHTYTHSQ